jgi:hypothetical protein
MAASAPSNASGASSAPAAASQSSVAADSTAAGYVSSSAAVETGKDSTRKFIRTADLKFKVRSVIDATYRIEDITGKSGGFVTYTNLNSTIDNKTITAISADSSLETTYFTVANSMVLRVPNRMLDSTLKAIAVLIDYLDFRVIKAEDVGLQILSNQLEQQRLARHEKRLTSAIDSRGRKLEETTTAEENLLNRQGESDAAGIANLSLQDQIQFSTINLSIYQRQAVTRELIANDRNIEEYEPGIGSKLLEALKVGWKALEAVVIFLARLWALILFGIIVYIIYRKYVRDSER